jgi:hypothetical protein
MIEVRFIQGPYMWRRVKFKAMNQQIQGLNTEEKGLEISKLWRWIVQNATLINEFQTALSDSFFIHFWFFGVKKHTYALYYSTFWAKFVVFCTRTATHWGKHFGKCPLTVWLSTALSAFFKEFSLGGAKQEKRQNEKYEPLRFGERASLKRDFVKL